MWALLEIKSGKGHFPHQDENFSMQWDSLEDFSSLSLRSLENRRPLLGDAFVPTNRGKTGALPLYEQDTKAHACSNKWICKTGSHERFSGPCPDLYARFYRLYID
jgi:hypothetical protein